MSKITIKAHSDGYRRAGLKLTKAGEAFDAGDLTNAQLDALHADPRVTVSESKQAGPSAEDLATLNSAVEIANNAVTFVEAELTAAKTALAANKTDAKLKQAVADAGTKLAEAKAVAKAASNALKAATK